MSIPPTSDLIEQFCSGDETACEALAINLGQKEATGLLRLVVLLAAKEADARFWAIRGLWANASPEAVTHLIKTLSDGEEMVRSGAALALGELKAEAGIEGLSRLLTADPSASGNHAADALSKIGKPAADALIEAMGHEQSWVRCRTAKALIVVESKKSIPALFEALDDESYMVRHYAKTALARMGVGQMVYFKV